MKNALKRINEHIKPYQTDIVIAGYVAGLGTAVIADKGRKKLCEIFSEPFVNKAAAFKDYITSGKITSAALSCGAEYVFSFGEGGIFSGLWKMAEELKVGLSIELRKIPIKQETIELCEVYKLNPYFLDSTGAIAIVTEDGRAMEEAMLSKGIPAAYVGTINDGNDRIITNDDEVRYLNRPQEDELVRFLADGC